MLNFDKIYELLRIALITGAINSLFIQKIKCKFISNDCIIILISIITSMLIGTLFTLTFTNFSLTYSLWVGIFTFVHAEAIFNVLKKAETIKVNTDNNENNNDTNEDDLGEG